MAFPTIGNCIVCEEIRLELNRKATILGFYGIIPHVEILLQDFSKPMDRLTFFMSAGKGAGKFTVHLQVQSEAGDVVFNYPDHPLELRESTRRNNLVYALRGISFPHPGAYVFRLRADGKNQYEASFQVNEGKPEDFR